MIVKTFQLDQYPLVHKNLAWEQQNNVNTFSPTMVFIEGEHHVFIGFSNPIERLGIDENRNLYLHYFGMNNVPTALNALRTLVLNEIVVSDFESASIDFEIENFSKKYFAELIYGYQTLFKIEPFLKLQWKPIYKEFGIRFIWTLK